MPLARAPIAMILCVAIGFGGGYTVKSWVAERDLARIQAAQADEHRAAAEASASRLAASQDAERAAVITLEATRARRDTQTRRLDDALRTLPTAADCGLSGPALGLLNAALAADSPGAVPAPAAQPARAAAGAAADSGAHGRDAGATEYAVGAWIAGAINLYGACVARIDALRQWDEEMNPTTMGDGYGR